MLEDKKPEDSTNNLQSWNFIEVSSPLQDTEESDEESRDTVEVLDMCDTVCNEFDSWYETSNEIDSYDDPMDWPELSDQELCNQLFGRDEESETDGYQDCYQGIGITWEVLRQASKRLQVIVTKARRTLNTWFARYKDIFSHFGLRDPE